MVGMVVVAQIGGLTGKLHREAEPVVVLGADLPQLLEFFDARYFRQNPLRVGEEFFLLLRFFRVLQSKYDRMANHFPSLSLLRCPPMRGSGDGRWRLSAA